MQRITLCCLLFIGLVAFACNTPTNGSSETSGDMANPQTTTGNSSTTGMDNGKPYTITTLDTTVKSPRKELTGTVNGVEVMINYGSPSVNDRTIYGDLVPYGKVWRTGANEATRITFKEDVKVGMEGTTLPAGTYSLFTLPADKNDWTVIFNKTAEQWGAYDYSEADDVVRVKGSSEELSSPAEHMDFALDGDSIELMWSDLAVRFPVAPAAR
ncbi:DUF2911 domain-containing protein [Lewinella sp. IMCC34183]|uniref:DUF2911 domain-containing protein n=1 Tax=Lewinella sp. IMCC34183 TaxID=2248762 RepID=UPI0018E5399E|nr:DUF2911 domain-containing protein [Lewinella sp. IMCC34183]